MEKKVLSLTLMVLVLFMSTAAFAAVRYVDLNASGGTQDGTSWNAAFISVQAGLNAAQAGDEVWVAQGTYLENLTMKNGVAVYGGFQGIETSVQARDWDLYPTTLNGNNVDRVILVDFCDNPLTRIDGFIITGGYVQDSINRTGGGVFSKDSTVTISNNLIIENTLITEGGQWAGSGGGISARDSAVTITNNVIQDNAGSGGAGLMCYRTTYAIVGNHFIGNYGGGLYLNNSSGSISRNRIENNWAGLGAGIFTNSWTAGDDTIISNNIIVKNESVAQYGGGGLYLSGNGSNLIITNNTIAYNTSNYGNGGGITIMEQTPATLANNIIAFNTQGIYSHSTAVLVLRNNNFFGNNDYNYSGVAPGTGDISADPIFFDAAVGNYQLGFGSPSMETASVLDAPADDFVGVARPQDGDNDGTAVADMGAFEAIYQNPDVDNDGFYNYQDCNDNDPAINPGATEIKFDGIDQNCTGYDLTIDITTSYKAKKDLLTVNATSDLGSAANLNLEGHGLMTHSGNKWSIVVVPAGGNPGTVTVSGVEGTESASVY